MRDTRRTRTTAGRELQTNSRRVGVERGDRRAIVPLGVNLMQIDSEDLLGEVIKTRHLAKQLIQ
jgi:hypothetical protein